MYSITHNLLPVSVLLINAAASLSYFVIYSDSRLRAAFLELPAVLQKAYVALFVAPLFVAPFLPQERFSAHNPVLFVSGIILTMSGVLLITASFTQIGVIPSIKSGGGLSTTGAYGIVRHPIYSGTIIIQTGLTLVNHSLITLVYLPVSIMLYLIMATIEEKGLIGIFGNDYLEYAKRVKGKIIPFIL